jgi:S1-C subfamily serine protease
MSILRPLSAASPLVALIVSVACAAAVSARAGELTQTLRQVKRGVVAVGTYQSTRRPPARLRGTGFVVADGAHVITNAHVVPTKLDAATKELLAVFAGTGNAAERRPAEVVAEDLAHDLVVLKIAGAPLPALRLGDDRKVAEGQAIAFTGFPVGAVLGLYPVTHRGIVSAVTPFVIPQFSARQLDGRMIRQMRRPFPVFQLDATAYPGNSGSPLYDPGTGEVYGVVNSVFVKGTKEKILREPTGISYAIPIRHAKALLGKIGLLDRGLDR